MVVLAPFLRLSLALALSSLALPRAAWGGSQGMSLAPHLGLEVVASGFDRPTAARVTSTGDWLIALQAGEVLALRSDGAQNVCLDLTDEVNRFADLGLLGLALDPGFEPNGGPHSHLYLLATVTDALGIDAPPGTDDRPTWGQVLRFRVETNGAGDWVAQPATREVLLGRREPDGRAPTALAALSSSHTGGHLAFAPDGSLLVSTGDGADFAFADTGGAQPFGFEDFVHPVTGLRGPLPLEQDLGSFRASSLESLSGKLLRIDPDTGLGLPSNPFFDGDPGSARSRVFALGLRNPFRFALEAGTGSTDPALGDPGRVWVGDVGSTLFEELNLVALAGADFGWPCFEGFDPQPDFTIDCSGATGLAPSFAFAHDPAQTVAATAPLFDALGLPAVAPLSISLCVGQGYSSANAPSAVPTDWLDQPIAFDPFTGFLLRAAHDGAGQGGSTQGASAQLTGLHTLATGLTGVVDVMRCPTTGDVFVLRLGFATAAGSLERLVPGSNLAPVAQLLASPASGVAPLDVTFDASASTDGDFDPLQYRFDFGDGAPEVFGSASVVQHAYPNSGLYLATCEVSDGFGGLSARTVPVAVGDNLPLVEILQPASGTEFTAVVPVEATGLGFAPDGSPAALSWSLDRLDNGVWTPGIQAGPGSNFSFLVEPPPDPAAVRVYALRLTATLDDGSTSRRSSFLHVAGQQVDDTGTLLPIQPALPLAAGSANPDVEVLRDGLAPTDGSASGSALFETRFDPPLVGEHSLGYELPGPAQAGGVFCALELTTGAFELLGGWFVDARVEVRSAGIWTPVPELLLDPLWPSGAALPAGGEHTRFRLAFEPTPGDAIRLIGTPGGTAGSAFVRASELRVLRSAPGLHVDLETDYSPLATPTAEFETGGSTLPADPQHPGLAVLVDGTEPPLGSTTTWGQVSGIDGTDSTPEDWFGLHFEAPVPLTGLLIQSGWPSSGEGFFEALDVVARLGDDAPFASLAGLQLVPRFAPGSSGSAPFSAYQATFEATPVTEVRVTGSVAGPTAVSASLAELRATGRWFDPALCGFEAVAAPGSLHPLELRSAGGGFAGEPFGVLVEGAAGPGPGFLWLGFELIQLPLGGDQVLLWLPEAVNLFPLAFGPSGQSALGLELPPNEALVGIEIGLQAAVLAPLTVLGWQLSDGLRLTVCP